MKLLKIYIFSAIAVAAFFPLFASASVCAIYTTAGAGTQSWGDTSSQEQIAQPFTVSSACVVNAVGIYAETLGSPADSPVIELAANNAGVPGTILDTGTNPTLTGSFAWATSTFSGGITVSPGSTYWIVYTRSGGRSPTDRYSTTVDNTSPPFSPLNRYNGTSWSTLSTYNSLFEVDGTPGSTPSPGLNPASEIFASSTLKESPVATYQIVDNPTQDFFMGVLLFILTMFGIVYLFKVRS